jgi:hypothetical protein
VKIKNKKTRISDYFDELEEKIKRDRENPEDNPKIGIFWLCVKDGKISIFLRY